MNNLVTPLQFTSTTSLLTVRGNRSTRNKPAQVEHLYFKQKRPRTPNLQRYSDVLFTCLLKLLKLLISVIMEQCLDINITLSGGTWTKVSSSCDFFSLVDCFLLCFGFFLAVLEFSYAVKAFLLWTLYLFALWGKVQVSIVLYSYFLCKRPCYLFISMLCFVYILIVI